MKNATTPATVHDQPSGAGAYPLTRQCRRSRGATANGTTTASGHSQSTPRRSSTDASAQAGSSSARPTARPIARSSTSEWGMRRSDR